MIVCIVGGLGSGKTLLMSALVDGERARGRVVAANYALRGALRFAWWEDLWAFRQGVYAWDEAHVDCDARLFAQNVEATSWFLQTRKLGLDLVMTTQSFEQIDLRLRQMVDCLILMSKLRAGVSVATVVDAFTMRIRRKALFHHSSELYGLYDSMATVERLRRRSKAGWQG